jgi:hypothetical protein
MIDPRIAMGAQAPNLQSSLKLFQDTLNNIQGRKMNAQSMAQNEQMNPLRLQEAQQVVDSNANTAATNKQNQNIQSIAAYAPTLRKFLDNGDNMGAAQSLTQRIDFLERNGRDPTESREALQAITNGNPDMVLQALDIAEREAVSRGLVGNNNNTPVQLRTRQSLLNDLNSDNPDVVKSARVELNLDPRPSSAAEIQIANNLALAGNVATTQGMIAGEKARAEAQAEQPIKIRTEALSAAQKRSEVAIDTITKIRSEITNLDSAIDAIQSGAESGKVSNWFPSFRSETLKLQNAASRLGLNVVTATTFGALSEGELKLAMDVAVPTGLQPKELKEWLTVRKNARVKLANELEKMAISLGSGEMTSSEYLKKQKESDPLGLGL